MAIPVFPFLVAGFAVAFRNTETMQRVRRATKEAFAVAAEELRGGSHGTQRAVSVEANHSAPKQRDRGNRATPEDRRTRALKAARKAATAMALVVLYPELDRGEVTAPDAHKAQRKLRDLGYSHGNDVEGAFVRALNELCSAHGLQLHHEWSLVAVRTQDTFLLRATCPELPSMRITSSPYSLVSSDAVRRANAVIALESGENYAEGAVVLIQW